jgi:hypothetical protein
MALDEGKIRDAALLVVRFRTVAEEKRRLQIEEHQREAWVAERRRQQGVLGKLKDRR